jgi:hypothetical protein
MKLEIRRGWLIISTINGLRGYSYISTPDVK